MRIPWKVVDDKTMDKLEEADSDSEEVPYADMKDFIEGRWARKKGRDAIRRTRRGGDNIGLGAVGRRGRRHMMRTGARTEEKEGDIQPMSTPWPQGDGGTIPTYSVARAEAMGHIARQCSKTRRA